MYTRSQFKDQARCQVVRTAKSTPMTMWTTIFIPRTFEGTIAIEKCKKGLFCVFFLLGVFFFFVSHFDNIYFATPLLCFLFLFCDGLYFSLNSSLFYPTSSKFKLDVFSQQCCICGYFCFISFPCLPPPPFPGLKAAVTVTAVVSQSNNGLMRWCYQKPRPLLGGGGSGMLERRGFIHN